MGEYVNSNQLRFDRSHVSCGVMEVHHLPNTTASKTLFSLVTGLYHKANPRPTAFVMFSDVVGETNESRGELLVRAIEKVPGSGFLMATTKEVNPRTGNVIQLWVWTPNHDTMRKWYQDELANRIEE